MVVDQVVNSDLIKIKKNYFRLIAVLKEAVLVTNLEQKDENEQHDSVVA